MKSLSRKVRPFVKRFPLMLITAALLAGLISSILLVQNAFAAITQIDISGIFNADVVANYTGGEADPANDGIDSDGATYYTQTGVENICPTDPNPAGIPDDGVVPESDYHPEIDLAVDNADNGDNAFRAGDDGSTAAIDVPDGAYDYLHIYAISTNGSSSVTLTLTYTDASTETTGARTIRDWFDDQAETNDEYYLLDDMDRDNGSGCQDADDPAIFGVRFPVDGNKDLDSFVVNYDTTGNDTSGIFVLFGAATQTVPKVVPGANTVPADGAVYAPGPTQIIVEFSESVKGGSSLDGAENTDNYLLVEAGPNGAFNTTSCAVPGAGAVAPDDVKISVDTATYDSDSFITTLDINGGTPLPEGTYRLYICGTTSIENLFGLKLNGGTDSHLNFSVQAAAPAALPATGFAMGRVTALPAQPASKAYSNVEMTLDIPALGVEMPIVGVPVSDGEWDVTWLGRSAGYLSGSAFPTWNGNTVLTGHVWDAWNQPGPFAKLKTLQYGDYFYIQAWGLTYTYEVRENKLVWPSRVNSAFQHEELDWVTLLSCENYNPFPWGDMYFHRRVVRAVLVSVK